jgi:hypothetical protein
VADQEFNLNASAVLRKWPSLKNERIPNAWGAVPYLICEATLAECIRKFGSYPISTRHLYEIHLTKPDAPVIVLPPEQIAEFARFHDFLGKEPSTR